MAAGGPKVCRVEAADGGPGLTQAARSATRLRTGCAGCTAAGLGADGAAGAAARATPAAGAALREMASLSCMNWYSRREAGVTSAAVGSGQASRRSWNGDGAKAWGDGNPPRRAGAVSSRGKGHEALVSNSVATPDFCCRYTQCNRSVLPVA